MVKLVCTALVSVAACAALPAGAARASTASVGITSGGLTMSNPSVTVISRNPTELDLRTVVTDARGTGTGWFVSLAAAASSAPASASLIVTGADATCASGSACTVPVNAIAYPEAAGLTGARTRVFQAAPTSGLGAQSIDLHVVVPDTVASKLDFDLSLATPLSPDSATGSTSLPCSIPDLVATGTCPGSP